MYRVNQYVPPPAPKPPSRTPIVVGTVLATLGTVAIVGAALTFRVRRHATSEATAASDSAHAASPPSAGAQAPRVPTVAPMPPAEDEPEPMPAAPGTPRSSEHARPAWARDTSYAPQLADALDVFLAAAPLRGDLSRGLLVCRVQSFNKMDTFAGDDLRVSVVFPGAPGRTNNGPEDANLAFVSAPLAQLTHGDTVRFEVWDRDVFDDELITRTQTRYDAGPLVLADTGASIECRALEGAALDQQTKLHGERADKQARALSAHKLDGHRPSWGWPATEVGGAERAAADVAALVGWDDPRTKKRVDSLAVALASLEAQKGRVFAELRAAAKVDADVRGLHAHLEELACGPRKAAVGAHAATSPCVARVSLRNDSADVVTFAPYSGPQAYVATSASGPKDARFENLPKTEIAPQETLEVLIVPEGVAIDAEAALVGLCVGSTCDVLLAR